MFMYTHTTSVRIIFSSENKSLPPSECKIP